MPIIFRNDTYKINLGKKTGISLIILSSALIFSIIVANFYWLFNYDYKSIANHLINMGKKSNLSSINAYVRFVGIFTIVGNALVIILFSSLTMWGINKRKYGIGFGLFWVIVFIGNGIGISFYSIQVDFFSIISAIINITIAIILLIWLSNAIAYKQRLRQEIARRGRNSG